MQYSCKDCYRANARLYAVHPKNHATRNYEALVIKKLRNVGIYATTGKCSEWKWLDIVAWGCVKIETKATHLKSKNHYQFSLTSQSRQKHFDVDIIILVCIDDKEQSTFHLFSATHPVFCRTSGELKKGIVWTPGAKPKPKPGQGISLTDDLMAEAKDHWGIIERVRQEIIANLQK